MENSKKEKPLGVCLGWDGKPHLAFRGGKYLPSDAEKILYPEYFKEGEVWPIDPTTNQKMRIANG